VYSFHLNAVGFLGGSVSYNVRIRRLSKYGKSSGEMKGDQQHFLGE
jgi:hypothetical protein